MRKHLNAHQFLPRGKVYRKCNAEIMDMQSVTLVGEFLSVCLINWSQRLFLLIEGRKAQGIQLWPLSSLCHQRQGPVRSTESKAVRTFSPWLLATRKSGSSRLDLYLRIPSWVKLQGEEYGPSRRFLSIHFPTKVSTLSWFQFVFTGFTLSCSSYCCFCLTYSWLPGSITCVSSQEGERGG